MLSEMQVGADGKVIAPMEPSFAAFKGAFGGWTAAHALVAARTLGPRDFLPAALSIDFLSPIGPGSVESKPQRIHVARSAQFISVDTTQHDKLCARTSILQATRRPTERIDAASMPTCSPATELNTLKVYVGQNTWIERFEMRNAQGRLLQPNTDLRSLIWTRLLSKSPDDYATVAALADASFPRIFYHFDEISPIATVTMSVHFHADAGELQKGLEDFVLIESEGQIAGHGFFDQQVRIWSGAGLLLATSSQLARYDRMAN